MEDQTKTVYGHAAGRELGPKVGDVVVGYELKALLAEGGQGSVFSVVHQMLGRPAAMKVLHEFLASVPEMTERFIREAKIVNQLRHPCIVDVYDLGLLPDGRPYMVMELLKGRTLSAILLQGRMEPDRALEFLRAIGEGLSAAHSLGVVHRDVKGGNVFVTQETSPVAVKLLDFGIAKFMIPEEGTAGLTRVGERLGSAGSMAPEQYLGSTVDERTDVYGLAVTAYRMVTGRFPFVSIDPIELERMHLEVTPRRPSDLAPVPRSLDAVLLKALEKYREKRHPSVKAFLDDFAAALQAGDPVGVNAGADAAGESVGLIVEIGSGDESQEDDEFLVSLADLLDTGERLLHQQGFQIEQQGNRQLCGVRHLAAGDSGVDEATRIAQAGEELFRLLSAHAPQMHITVSARVGTHEVTRLKCPPPVPE